MTDRETKGYAPMTDAEFDLGGGHDFAAEVAAGVTRRCNETFEQQGRGVMLNAIEMLWLAESHRRLMEKR